ncbi:MAG: NHL repeat-containing protein [Marinirhabdus sp.]
MKKTHIIFLAVLTLAACVERPKSWQLARTITTKGVNPIGIAQTPEGIWLSDGDHKRVVRVDENGKITQRIDPLERPMHIASNGGALLIPLYGEDRVLRWEKNKVAQMAITDSLDAPAGVWQTGNETAIADFYNHRVLYSPNGSDWVSFGKEGRAEGDLYYPTDVQITKDKIWVADAYNNRVQVFTKQGGFLKAIGKEQKMNASTGIYVSGENLFVTDFENDRVLVFDLDGNLIQEISEKIEKPTDVLLSGKELYVTNYRNGKVTVFEKREMPTENANKDEHGHEHEHEH